MNPDIQPHELADMRRTADKAPHDTQQKFHALLDAYEDQAASAEITEHRDELRKNADNAVTTLRGVYPSNISDRPTFGEPLSEGAWHEKLEDCNGAAERHDTVQEELTRARAAEVQLRARVEALEEAIESALDELE